MAQAEVIINLNSKDLWITAIKVYTFSPRQQFDYNILVHTSEMFFFLINFKDQQVKQLN